MIKKQFFKLFLSTLLIALATGCNLGKGQAVNSKEKKEVEGLETGIENQNLKPAIYLIVGFAGLTDPGTHPADWSAKIQKMIEDKSVASANQPTVHTLLIKRSSENKTVQEHADEAHKVIIDYLVEKGIGDFNNVKLILIGESYGGLVAGQLALEDKLADLGTNIAGLITVRTPWEGVELITGIEKVYPMAIMLQGTHFVAGLLGRYNNYKKVLETMDPANEFILRLKTTSLGTLGVPILALAGNNDQPTFTYKILQELFQLELPLTLEKLQSIGVEDISNIPEQYLAVANMLGPMILPGIKTIIQPFITPYQPNDGLVLTSSATAANSNKGVNFESHVLSNFPHIGDTTNHAEALGYVRNFVDKIVK